MASGERETGRTTPWSEPLAQTLRGTETSCPDEPGFLASYCSESRIREEEEGTGRQTELKEVVVRKNGRHSGSGSFCKGKELLLGSFFLFWWDAEVLGPGMELTPEL